MSVEVGLGGTVLVRPGSYNESLRMFPGVSVVSTDGPSVTTIDATGTPCTTVECVPSLINLTCSARQRLDPRRSSRGFPYHRRHRAVS
jgi:hypothetical protein